MLFVLGFTLFVSAFLLFCCEPMAGKMVLPILGGAASVWTTCVLFFQVMLLVGYVYAHVIGKLRRLMPQILIHTCLMLAALSFLPIRFTASGHPSESPVWWLLVQLSRRAGVPFAVISATAPLIQSWYSRTRLSSARDPYFLYSASNAGSLLALIAYPVLIEPYYGVNRQGRLWFDGYAGLSVMMIVSAMFVWYVSRSAEGADAGGVENREGSAPSWTTRLFWLAAAFVPSALMLAVTNHISSNVGAVPLLWVIPLASYLLTFILAFARNFRFQTSAVSLITTIVLLVFFPLAAVGVFIQPASLWKLVACHVAILFFAALLCHSSLADRRPPAKYLTEFYFVVALGGVLGGIFTAIIAPMVFKTVFEYPLLVAMVPFFRRPKSGLSDGHSIRTDGILLVAYGLLIGLALYGVIGWARIDVTGFSVSVTELKSRDTLVIVAVQAVLIAAALLFRKRVVSFGIAFAMLILIYATVLTRQLQTWEPLSVSRNFFGVKRVLADTGDKMIRLQHGDTIHGVESQDSALSGEPLGYYLRTGPLGDVMQMLGARPSQHYGVVGLGAGTIAAYGSLSRHVTFFEIDPQVSEIAYRYFTFLRRCADNCDVSIGDGRLLIEGQPPREYDVLVLDAFNSDSIPAHLISREAIRAYLSKLKPEGVLLFHVPNRYLDIEKLATAVAIDEGLFPFVREDYVAAVRRREDLGGIPNKESWKASTRASGFEAWTDDYSNLMTLIRWEGK
jgi:SAM-dependent methyltransferase